MADEFKHLSAGTSLTQGEYEAVGGHVLACQATGDIVYASSGSQLSRLGKGAANTVLAMGGSCVPAWTASPSVTDLTIGGGCITLSAATDIDLLDNTTSALSFDASGKTGIIDINTNNCSEGVTMSGTLGVTGVLTANAGVVVDNFTLDGTELDLSSGNFALDVAGDVEINADGGCVNFKDASLALAAIVNSSCVGELRIHEAANYVGFKAPALSGDQIWTLPAAVASSACDVLTCNGSGVLSWATAGGGGGASAVQVNDNVAFAAGTGSDSKIYYDGTDSHWDLRDTGTGALVIALGACHPSPDGNAVHIWEGTAGSVTARTSSMLILESCTCDEITLQFLMPGGGTAQQAIMFGDAGCVTEGTIIYDHPDRNMRFGTKGSPSMTIDGDQVLHNNGCKCTPSLSFRCDKNTGMYRFGACDLALTSGGSEKAFILTGSQIYMKDCVNSSHDTYGLTINQACKDNAILSFKSSDVAHGMTGSTETDTYAFFKKNSANAGGLDIYALNDGGSVALSLIGLAVANNSTKSGSGNGAINLRAAVKCGTGTAAFSANDNMVYISDFYSGSTKFIFDADGDIHVDGSTSLSGFDDYCDVQLLTAAKAVHYPECHDFRKRFSGFIDEYAQVLHDNKIVTMNPDGHHFISYKGMMGLTIDTIRQLHGRIETLETQLTALNGGK